MHTGIQIAVALATAILLWLASHGVQRTALAKRATWPEVAERKDMSVSFGRAVGYMGYRELGATLTWTQALVYLGGAGEDQADYRYLTKFIDNIILLDPYFKPVYRWAAYAVTFKEGKATQEEFHQSIHYLKKAMERFPDDYQYPWLAGLRYWTDLHDEDKTVRRRYLEQGAEQIERAMHCANAPPGLATLAAFFRTQLGQKQRAIDNLKQRILMTRDEQAKQRMINHLGALTDAQVAEDWDSASTAFLSQWRANLPHASTMFYSLVGPRPSPLIDFDQLATERDLVGADLELD